MLGSHFTEADDELVSLVKVKSDARVPFSVKVLDRAMGRYGMPKSTLSDHGSTFCGVETREKG